MYQITWCSSKPQALVHGIATGILPVYGMGRRRAGLGLTAYLISSQQSQNCLRALLLYVWEEQTHRKLIITE